MDLVDLGADFVRKGIVRKGGSAYGALAVIHMLRELPWLAPAVANNLANLAKLAKVARIPFGDHQLRLQISELSQIRAKSVRKPSDTLTKLAKSERN